MPLPLQRGVGTITSRASMWPRTTGSERASDHSSCSRSASTNSQFLIAVPHRCGSMTASCSLSCCLSEGTALVLCEVFGANEPEQDSMRGKIRSHERQTGRTEKRLRKKDRLILSGSLSGRYVSCQA